MVKFNDEDKKLWNKFRLSKRDTISRSEFQLVCKLHAEYYKHKYYEPCTCSPTKIKKFIQELNIIWDNEH